MLGPVFARELVTLPRRGRLHFYRAAYVGGLLLISTTAWQVLAGTGRVQNVGDLARFGATLFQVLAPLQMVVAVFFAALTAASRVALEKDRQTLVLLLLTRLTNVELVLGKLTASLMGVLALLVAGLPLFMLSALLGGVSFAQIGSVLLVTMAATVLAGSLGSTLAFWRDKTFQTLAMTAMAIVFWTAACEAVARGAFGDQWRGLGAATWAAGLSPWHAVLEATRPFTDAEQVFGAAALPVALFLAMALAATAGLNGLAILRVRAWNPSREVLRAKVGQVGAITSEAADAGPLPRRVGKRGASRGVWDNPVLWREVRTWAYGRRVVVIRLAYLLLSALSAIGLRSLVWLGGGSPLDLALPLVPLLVVSLMLVNMQAVTAVTSERDHRALDLLLVTDVTAKEFVYGKLGGIFYNTKEMILVPLALCGYLWYVGALGDENLLYLWGGWLVMAVFAAVLGLHVGMNYANSRAAIAVSLGTVFFLVVGVAVSMRILVAFSGSFTTQLQAFFAAMVGGGVGLYVALGHRNPSPAIGIAAFLLPVATFYALTSFLMQGTLVVFLVVAATYGFATLAMLVPAVYEFDVATGRTTAGEGE